MKKTHTCMLALTLTATSQFIKQYTTNGKRIIMVKTLFLALLAGICMKTNAQTTDYDTNRGFIHPGGLHTQADFDRVKQQLADGNAKVTAAYKILTSAAYAQASVGTSPTEMVIRGGNGENYMNAARGATAAYQNALRWKIEGKKANADAAVRIMMDWARTTTGIGGDSNSFLASGLYGYPFAQAAELMRDYEGWSREDFEEFKRWMLDVWYPKAIDFLRRRNGSWENSGRWWQAPGHYWSNWSLANLLTVMSIGILCDDVYIYNQALSFFKYDQCGTFSDPPVMHEVTGHEGFNGQTTIWNDGLTDFLGNFVVTCVESELEAGAYGHLGQMNESGRDGGHCALALGLAVDVAKVGWHQGDDLFAYMDHRLAAGVEYVAAQTQNMENLPWTNYLYYTNGFAYTDGRSQLMTGPALPVQIRPYWGTIIGIYEGVKGVAMPFAELAYNQMGIDEGAQGSTSGGYDHMGYSVLMNTRDPQLCPPELVPTELTPLMEYSGTINSTLVPSLANEKKRGLIDGKKMKHNELGGLVNTYAINNNTCLPPEQTVHLMPQLPDGEEDTGQWLWNTGETTRDITITTDRSYIYRVTYTNSHGVESQLNFSIAAKGDCRPERLVPTITVGNEVTHELSARVFYGKSATLAAHPFSGFGTWNWTGNKTTEEITASALRKTTDYILEYTNQGGAVTTLNFHLDVVAAQPYAIVNGKELSLQEEEAVMVADKFLAPSAIVCVEAGNELTLGLTLPSAVRASNVIWDDGTTGDTYVISDVQESHTRTATFTLSGEEVHIRFNILVKSSQATIIEPGTYRLRHIATDTYLTAQAKSEPATFEPLRSDDDSQLWLLERNDKPKYMFTSLAGNDSLQINSTGTMVASTYYPFFIDKAVSVNRIAIHSSTTATPKYWDVSDGTIEVTTEKDLVNFPFELQVVGEETGIEDVVHRETLNEESKSFDLSGREIGNHPLPKGIYVRGGKKYIQK